MQEKTVDGSLSWLPTHPPGANGWRTRNTVLEDQVVQLVEMLPETELEIR